MNYTTILDARTAVSNSGVVDWDWGILRDSASVLDDLACFIYTEDIALDDDALRRFIVEVLGEDPAEYSTGK